MCFFYMRLGERPTGDPGDDPRGLEHVQCAHRVLEHYGLSAFLADLDEGRQFWRESGCIAAVLAWLAGEGFREYFGRYGEDFPYRTPADFRARHLDRFAASIRALAHRG